MLCAEQVNTLVVNPPPLIVDQNGIRAAHAQLVKLLSAFCSHQAVDGCPTGVEQCRSRFLKTRQKSGGRAVRGRAAAPPPVSWPGSGDGGAVWPPDIPHKTRQAETGRTGLLAGEDCVG